MKPTTVHVENVNEMNGLTYELSTLDDGGCLSFVFEAVTVHVENEQKTCERCTLDDGGCLSFVNWWMSYEGRDGTCRMLTIHTTDI